MQLNPNGWFEREGRRSWALTSPEGLHAAAHPVATDLWAGTVSMNIVGIQRGSSADTPEGAVHGAIEQWREALVANKDISLEHVGSYVTSIGSQDGVEREVNYYKGVVAGLQVNFVCPVETFSRWCIYLTVGGQHFSLYGSSPTHVADLLRDQLSNFLDSLQRSVLK